MFKWLPLLALLLATPAAAQNVTCTTRPPGDNSNACASTAFVHGATTTGLPLAATNQLYGGSGTAGAANVVTVGSGLSLSGETLSATGGKLVLATDFAGVDNTGTTNSTAGLTTAISSATAAGNGLLFPCGTYLVDDVPLVTNARLQAAVRQCATLKRINAATGHDILSATSVTGWVLDGFIFDGNSPNNASTPNYDLLLSGAGQFSIRNSRFLNYISTNAATFGVGIQCNSSVDQANSTNSDISNNTVLAVSSNALSGIILNGCSNVLVQGNVVNGNLYAGIAVLAASLPVPTSPININDTITGNTTNSNGIGIDIAGATSGQGIGNQPILSTSNFVNEEITVTNNVMELNGSYGCLVQATIVTVSHNTITGNGHSAHLGGCAVTSAFPAVTGNNISFNDLYGLDMGASTGGTVTGNTITGNHTSAGVGIGMNFGASQALFIGDNYIAANGTAAGSFEMLGHALDGATAGNYFPLIGNALTIKGVHIGIGSSSDVGLLLDDGWQFGVTVSDVDINNVLGAPSAFQVLVGGSILRLQGNREFNSGATYTPNVASAASTVVPDDADTVNITGAVGITNIFGYAQNALNGGLREFTTSNTGNGGYTAGATASCTSTGGTPATVVPARSANGHIYGLAIVTPGGGASAMSCTASDQTCTATPGAVTLSGGAVTAIGAGSGGSGCTNPPAVVISGLTCTNNPQVYANVSAGAVTSYGIAYGGSGCTGSGTASILNGSGFAGTAVLNAGTQDQLLSLRFASTPTISSGTGNVFIVTNYTGSATGSLGLRSSFGNWIGMWRQ